MTAPRARFIVAGVAAALSGAVALGRATAHPPVRVVERVVERVQTVKERAQEKQVQSGPRTVTRVVTRIVPGPRGPERTVERTQVVQGPTTVLTRSAEMTNTVRDVERTLSVTPAPPPSWSVTLGAQLSPAMLPHVALAHRIFGQVWLEAWATPQLAFALPAAGAGVRVEW